LVIQFKCDYSSASTCVWRVDIVLYLSQICIFDKLCNLPKTSEAFIRYPETIDDTSEVYF